MFAFSFSFLFAGRRGWGMGRLFPWRPEFFKSIKGERWQQGKETEKNNSLPPLSTARKPEAHRPRGDKSSHGGQQTILSRKSLGVVFRRWHIGGIYLKVFLRRRCQGRYWHKGQRLCRVREEAAMKTSLRWAKERQGLPPWFKTFLGSIHLSCKQHGFSTKMGSFGKNCSHPGDWLIWK